MHTDGFTLEWDVCCKGYLQLQVALCVNQPDCKATPSLLSHRYVGCSVNAYWDEISPFFMVFMRVSMWSWSCRLAHQWQQPSIRGAWRLPWHGEGPSLSVWQRDPWNKSWQRCCQCTGKGQEQGAACAKHSIMLFFPAWCCLQGAARCPKAGRTGGKRLWPLQQAYCSGDI